MTTVLRYALFAVFLLGLTSCELELTQGDNVRSDVEGTLFIDLPEFGTDDFFPDSETFSNYDLKGSVLITVGNTVHVVYPSAIEYNDSSHRLKVPVFMTASFEGVAVVTCVSRLFYEKKQPESEDPDDENPLDENSDEEESLNTPSIPYAGYLITTIHKDTINKLNDTDNSGYSSFFEENITPLTKAVRFYEYFSKSTPFEPAEKPEVSLSVANFFTDKLVTTISGTVSSLDWALVYVRVNNQYQWIETVADTLFAGQVSFPKDTDTTVVVPLQPGTNEIQLFAVNSQGLTISPIKEIKCTAQKDEDKENLLVTLTWDSFADLDLHTWYYSEESGDAVWHNYYFQPDVPVSDGLTNLDADKKTGLGPEHFTLLGAEDGYYVIAVNAYSSEYIAPQSINAFVTVETNSKRHSLGPFRISEKSAEVYPVNGSLSWSRIADIHIKDGEATLLDPDRFIEPPNLLTSPNSSLLNVNAQKRLIKNR